MLVIFNNCWFLVFSPAALKSVQTVIANATMEESSAADGGQTSSFALTINFFHATTAQWIVVKLEIKTLFSIVTHCHKFQGTLNASIPFIHFLHT